MGDLFYMRASGKQYWYGKSGIRVNEIRAEIVTERFAVLSGSDSITSIRIHARANETDDQFIGRVTSKAMAQAHFFVVKIFLPLAPKRRRFRLEDKEI